MSQTPWQRERAAAEETGEWRWGPFHRHFANDAVHRDSGAECDQPGTPRRVYVFDDDILDEHERAVAQYAIRHPAEFLELSDLAPPPLREVPGRINLSDPYPMVRVTVRVERPDGKELELTWPGAIDLEVGLDEMWFSDFPLTELEPTMWSRMEVSFKALPVQGGGPFARRIAMRIVDERAAGSGGPGEGLPPVAPQAGRDDAAGTPG